MWIEVVAHVSKQDVSWMSMMPDLAMASKAVLEVVLGNRVIVYVSDTMTVSGLPEQAGCLTHRI